MNYFLKARNFVKKNEKYISPIAIFGGFIVDAITLQRIDMLFENLILASYILMSGILVLMISFVDLKKNPNKFLLKIRPFLGIALLFVFGGVFSGFTIFYSRSANIISAWPFLIILLGVMFGTEYAKKYFTRMTIQITVFYFALFSYLIFLVPILFKSIGYLIFISSGIISLIIIYLYLKVFQKIIGKSFDNIKLIIFRSIIGVFVLINFLYFTNIIPPIPLSLKNADIYHLVERKNGEYVVWDEERTFIEKISFTEKVHVNRGDTLYFFSSVFAPTRLNTQIVHEWQYKDDKNGWTTYVSPKFSIYGGRDGGYRGYSVVHNLFAGKWRVNIKVPTGQTVGRKNFEIIQEGKTRNLITKIK